MPLTLGRLASVPLREVWAGEARDFTPWLAESDNISLLAETLGLSDLDVQGREVPVGSFYIDILARDAEGRVVVIENQFGPTDHTHLGQILTYVAGQEGNATVVWIAETVRDEHRAAIDWLNASTVEAYNFFAVEVEALRIGDSPPAPRFSVVAKPNNWSRGIGRATRASSAPLDDRARGYIAYWAAFGQYLVEHGARYRMPTPAPRGNACIWGIGRSGFALADNVLLDSHRLRVEIYITHRAAKRAFDLLEAERTGIESEVGHALDWQRLDDRQACRIAVHRTDVDPRNEDQRPLQYAWMLDETQRFDQAFRGRIRTLALENVGELAAGD
jgi:hypothetical protein